MGNVVKNKITIYQNRMALARTFGISRSKVYDIVDEIKKQIELGRYNRYAILDNEVNVGVFADYLKYRKLLKGKNTRKYVPPFNLRESLDMVIPEEVVDDAV